MAAMAIDGGFLLIGLAEDKETGAFSLAPQPTANLRERVESVAATAIDPPLDVRVTRIPAGDQGPGREPLGYLLIEVPPSPRAPHQVNFVYYGRGETSNRRLSDAEVKRLHDARASQVSRGEVLLAREVGRDPVHLSTRQSGHLYLIAEPISAAGDVAMDFLRRTGIEGWIHQNTALYDAPGLSADDRRELEFLGQVERRGDGWATTTRWLGGTGRAWRVSHDDPLVERYLMDIEFLNGGGIRCLIGQATTTDGQRNAHVADRRIVSFARRLVHWAAEYGRQIGYRGSWLLGVHVNGLRGLQAIAFSGVNVHYTPPRPYAPTYRHPVYPDDVYERVIVARAQEIAEQPAEVTARLVRDLTWALASVDQHGDIFEAVRSSTQTQDVT
jgi:hypothetical protein